MIFKEEYINFDLFWYIITIIEREKMQGYNQVGSVSFQSQPGSTTLYVDRAQKLTKLIMFMIYQKNIKY